jgi:hypothetical protein
VNPGLFSLGAPPSTRAENCLEADSEPRAATTIVTQKGYGSGEYQRAGTRPKGERHAVRAMRARALKAAVKRRLSFGAGARTVVAILAAVSSTAIAAAPSGAVTAVTVPGPPTSVVATAASTIAAVSWAAPVNNGGSPITKYTAVASPGGKKCSSAGPLACTVTGLTNGTAYTFTVTAKNKKGVSALSVASTAVTPLTLPSAPLKVIGVHDDRRVTVSWNAPASTGGLPIDSYVVTATPSGRRCTASTDRSCTVVGLTNGTAYTFTVSATTGFGTGPMSTPSAAVTPSTYPDAPLQVTAVPNGTKVTVTWAPPASDGGAPITGYTATASNGSAPCVTTKTTCVFTGLVLADSPTFSVQASNLNGPGLMQAGVPLATVPGAPTNVAAASSSTKV